MLERRLKHLPKDLVFSEAAKGIPAARDLFLWLLHPFVRARL